MSNEDPLGAVVISAREIYDEVKGMREDIRPLIDSTRAMNEKLGDHESRIRSIERWKYAIPAATILSLGAAFYSKS